MEKNKKSDRARIFMPFDALKGFREALAAKEKVLVSKPELSEDQYHLLDDKLEKFQIGDMLKIVYYEEEEYIEVEGILTKKDEIYKTIRIVKKVIPIKNIISIDFLENKAP